MATKDELEIELTGVKTQLEAKDKEIEELKKHLEAKGIELEEKEKELEELKASNNEDLTPEELFKKKLDNIQEALGTVQTNPDGLQEEIKRRLEVNNNKRLNKDDYIYLMFYHWVDTDKNNKFSIGELIKFCLKIREFLKLFKK